MSGCNPENDQRCTILWGGSVGIVSVECSRCGPIGAKYLEPPMTVAEARVVCNPILRRHRHGECCSQDEAVLTRAVITDKGRLKALMEIATLDQFRGTGNRSMVLLANKNMTSGYIPGAGAPMFEMILWDKILAIRSEKCAPLSAVKFAELLEVARLRSLLLKAIEQKDHDAEGAALLALNAYQAKRKR